MRLTSLCVPVASTVLGGWMILQARSFPPAASQYDPGPGAFPALIGWGFLLVGAGVGVAELLRGLSITAAGGANGRHRIFAIMGGIALYATLFERLGYVLATATGLWIWSVTLGEGRLRAGVFALAVAVISYFAFHYLLGVRLPTGVLSW